MFEKGDEVVLEHALHDVSKGPSLRCEKHVRVMIEDVAFLMAACNFTLDHQSYI